MGKQTRKATKKDTSGQPELRMKLGGRQYRLRPGDFTARDDMLVYGACGLSITQIFGGEIHLFTLMALLWRVRVHEGNDDLTFDEVLDEKTFAEFDDVELDYSGVDKNPAAGDAGEEVADGPPEG